MQACQPKAHKLAVGRARLLQELTAHKSAVGKLGGKGGHRLGLAIGNLEQHQGRVGAAVGALAPEQATSHDLDDVILVQVPQGRLTNGLHLISNVDIPGHGQKEGVTTTAAPRETTRKLSMASACWCNDVRSGTNADMGVCG